MTRIAAQVRLGVGAVIVAWALAAGTANARPFYPEYIPRPSTALNPFGQELPCITCHDNPDGGSGCAVGTAPCLNRFGLDFCNGCNTSRGVIPPPNPGSRPSIAWSMELALIDSDGDGFTNGQELQDALGTWVLGNPPAGTAARSTRPGFQFGSPYYDTPGLHDSDNDNYCWVGFDTNNDGICSGAEIAAGFDCNDAVATANTGATESCTNTIDDDCDGDDTFHDDECTDIVDADGDGYCPSGRDMNGDRDCLDSGETGVGVPTDCNDAALTVFTGAPENCSDGLDNDCDTMADMTDPQCTGAADVDGDGFCPVGEDLVPRDGDCLDGGENNGRNDCNDNAMAVHPDASEGTQCLDGLDNDCNSDADFEDAACAQFKDEDGDGYCPGGVDKNGDGNCASSGENVAPFDCNDANDGINPSIDEAAFCFDGLDQDCDGFPTGVATDSLTDSDCAAYIDDDGDGYCGIGRETADADNFCLPPENNPLNGTDCDDQNGMVNSAQNEFGNRCHDGDDNDCDGSADAVDIDCIDHADLDRDDYCVVGRNLNPGDPTDATGAPTGLDWDCSDSGEQGATVDADPFDPEVHPGALENCFDSPRDNDQDGLIDSADPDCNTMMDVDGDGFCPKGRDRNDDGDCTDAGEASNTLGDCDDGDPAISPAAPEGTCEPASGAVCDPTAPRDAAVVTATCTDLVDNNCNGDWDLFPRPWGSIGNPLFPSSEDAGCIVLRDLDGDGFCGQGIDDTGDGDCLDFGEDRFGRDCNDADPLISPSQSEQGARCTDGADNDCDGLTDTADSGCAQCRGNGDCDDSDVCTTDTCETGFCLNAPIVTCNADGGPDGGRPGGGRGCSAAGGAGAPWLGGLLLLAAMLAIVWRRREA